MKFANFFIGCLALFPTSATEDTTQKPESLNIVLSLTFGSKSHIKYLLEISKVLRERGHHITYATSKNNYRYNKDYNYTIYDIGGEDMDNRSFMKSIKLEDLINTSMSLMANKFTDLIVNSYEISFGNYEKLFKSQKVDLIICDFFAGVCSDAARKHGIPVIIGFQGMSFGVGSAPFITSTMDSSPTTTEQLNFFERFYSAVIEPIEMMYTFMPMSRKVNAVRAKYGVPHNPNPWGAFDEVMKISNTYIGFEDPRPIESTLKLIGPVQDDETPPLDAELQEFIDTHKTMYVAFGSNIILTPKLLQVLMGAMQLSIDNGSIDGVLWGLANTHPEDFPKSYKVNNQEFSTKSILEGTHPAIKILNWAPQTAILNHQNTKLFISHGGIESVHEGIHSGTPIIAMPIMGDQPRNGRLLKNRGIGDFVHPLSTDSNELYTKIKELTRENNIELQSRVKHIQSISQANNNKREETAKFLEHYAQSAKICRKANQPEPFGIPCELEPYMQADSRMSFITAYKIDILLTIAAISLIFSIFSIFILFKLVKLLITRVNSKKLKNE